MFKSYLVSWKVPPFPKCHKIWSFKFRRRKDIPYHRFFHSIRMPETVIFSSTFFSNKPRFCRSLLLPQYIFRVSAVNARQVKEVKTNRFFQVCWIFQQRSASSPPFVNATIKPLKSANTGEIYVQPGICSAISSEVKTWTGLQEHWRYCRQSFRHPAGDYIRTPRHRPQRIIKACARYCSVMRARISVTSSMRHAAISPVAFPFVTRCSDLDSVC